ncbi:DedA family protein [gamma proteobacterium HdN1]|nr:DedA family protein [gamma proteobacterium HdN1]
MGLEDLIRDFGYLAVFVGTFLEGETIQIMGGLAAHAGFLSLPWVIVIGCAGTLLGDQLYFFIGRRYGQRFLEKRPAWQARIGKVHNYIERYDALAILSFRFFYGIRNVASFAMGTSRIPFARFAILNATGAIIWATVMAGLGYFFGRAVEAAMGDIKRFEAYILVGVGVLGVAVYLVHARRTRQEAKKIEEIHQTKD